MKRSHMKRSDMKPPHIKQGYKAPPEAIDLARAERKIRNAATLSLLLFVVAVGLAYLLLTHLVTFPVTLAERLAFAARASAVVLFCVIVAVGMVSTIRKRSPEDIGGAAAGPPSERLAIAAAFLQNTLEQAVVAVGFYFAFVTLATGAWLAAIPVSVAFFVVGRILYLRGYPQGAEGRAFGMTLTMMPVILGYPAVFILMVVSWV